MDKNNAFQQLQMMEQNMQVLMSQKQQFTMQQAEIDAAANELGKNPDHAFKIIGNIMVSTNKDTLLADMKSKKEVLTLRIQSLDKQESKLKEKAKELQDLILSELSEPAKK